MSEEPQYLTRLASEIDEALERSDEIAELQDTRVLAAAYRQEKAPSEGLFHRLDIARDALNKSKGGE